MTIAEMDNLDHTIQRLEEAMDKVLDAGTISAHAPASSMSTEKPVAKAPSAPRNLLNDSSLITDPVEDKADIWATFGGMASGMALLQIRI